MSASAGTLRRHAVRPWILSVSVLVALGVAACGRDVVPVEDATDDREAVDRKMDLALGGEAEPELRDEPMEREPAEEVSPHPPPPPHPPPQPPPPPPPPPPAPEPEPTAADEPAPAEEPGPEMVAIVAPADATFSIELRQEVSTRNNRPGDLVTALITEPLIGGRFVVLPVNALVRGEVTAIQKSGGRGEPAIIKLDFYEVFHEGQAIPLHATIIGADPQTEGRYSTGDKAARIGGGAGAGAILGAILGGGKGAVIGAAVGAAAGTAITVGTEDVDAVLPLGSILQLKLDRPLEIIVPGR